MNRIHFKLILSTIISGIGAALFGGIMVSVFGGEFVTGAVYGGLVGAAGVVTIQYQHYMRSGAVFGSAIGVATGLLSGDLGTMVLVIVPFALCGAGIGWLLDQVLAQSQQIETQ